MQWIPPLNLSPEWRFVLASARTDIPLHDLQIGLASQDLDWDRVTEISYRHGIAPLIYYNLKRREVTGVVTSSALNKLKESYYGNAARNGLLYRELHKVLGSLKDVGIEVIVLKGAMLAETVYPNRALRPMNDIDLLVRKEAVSRAEDKLAELGYSLRESPRSKEWFKEYHHHLPLVRYEAGPLEIHLEVHWDIQGPGKPFKIGIDRIWSTALPVTIAGVECSVLSREDLLLHLCLHTCHPHKLTGGIRSLCDIAETIQRYGRQIDWNQLQTRSSRWRINQYVYLTLRLAKELLGAEVPDPVLDSLEPHGFDRGLVRWAREEILGDKEASPIFPELAQLWSGRRIKDRLQILVRILSPKLIAKYQGISPASKSIYLHYPARLKTLFLRYGPVLWGLVRCDRKLTAAAEGKARLAEWLNKC